MKHIYASSLYDYDSGTTDAVCVICKNHRDFNGSLAGLLQIDDGCDDAKRYTVATFDRSLANSTQNVIYGRPDLWDDVKTGMTLIDAFKFADKLHAQGEDVAIFDTDDTDHEHQIFRNDWRNIDTDPEIALNTYRVRR